MLTTDLTRQRFAAFSKIVEASPRSAKWLVLTHDNPDPDALVSAVLLARVLSKGFQRPVTAAYGGLIGRSENQELFRVLDAPFQHVRTLSWDDYQRFALVDAQPGTGNTQLPPEIEAHAVFDHHPLRKGTRGVAFHDVRPEYGATATILAEYLEAAGIDLPRAKATGLIYAIRSETQEFGRESAGPDKKIYDITLPKANKRLLSKIQNAPLPLSYFRILRQALAGLEAVSTLVLSHLGEVEQPDIVPELADLLLRLEGKTWSLVTGRYKERVYLSIRTTNPRAEAGRLMRRLVGKKGKGGGHGMTAGGWVPIKPPIKKNGAKNGSDPKAQQRQLGVRLARYLKKNPEKIQPLMPAPQPAAQEPVMT